MKITSVALFHAQLKLKQPFITSLGYRDHANNIYVRIKTDAGIEGWGECSPYAPINGETIDTCFIVGEMIGKSLLGMAPHEHRRILEKMDAVIYGNTSIKSAIDIACYDLAAKAEEKPLYAYLGGSIDKKIYTDYTVSVSDIPKMVADALQIKALGFPAIKVKLGDGKADDILRMRAIREAVGDDIAIRIDANQGWKVNQAIHILNEIKALKIQYCEEPINRHKYYKLKKVRNNSPIMVMADECLHDHDDARKLIKGEHCDMFNIKLGKSSGLYKAQKIVKEAASAQIPMQIGGFLESRILFTANCHLAHTHELIQYSDFDSPLFHEIDPVVGGMAYQKDWEIKLPESPGLGLHVDDAFLKNCRSLTVD